MWDAEGVCRELLLDGWTEFDKILCQTRSDTPIVYGVCRFSGGLRGAAQRLPEDPLVEPKPAIFQLSGPVSPKRSF